MKKTILTLALAAFLFSCSENEDVVKQPSKDGSIETTLTTKHRDGYDVLIVNCNVWVNGTLNKSFVTSDTIKSLGYTTQEGEDTEGNTKDIKVPKDYEFYITVK